MTNTERQDEFASCNVYARDECADCWAQFGKEIRHEFLGGSYGPRHIGKIPEKTPDGKPSRAFLEKELRDAVTRQNYRKAAKIRKLLDELNGETK